MKIFLTLVVGLSSLIVIYEALAQTMLYLARREDLDSSRRNLLRILSQTGDVD